MKWLTEQEALAYGGLTGSALRSRRQRGLIPSQREGKSFRYQEGPWLLPTPSTLRRRAQEAAEPDDIPEEKLAPVSYSSVSPDTSPVDRFPKPQQLFPSEDVPLDSEGETWVLRALQTMDTRAAVALARQMVLCHPQLPSEVKALILEFWEEDAR